MRCPACASTSIAVIDTRGGALEAKPAVRRRRECAKCAHRWTTYEIAAEQYERLEQDIARRFAQALYYSATGKALD